MIDGWEGVYVGPFLDMVEPHVVDLLAKNRQNKVYLLLTCIMERPHITAGEEETDDSYFRSNTEIILEATDVSEFYQKAADQIKNDYDIYERKATGSNWRFRRIDKLDIYMAEYHISLGGSYIPTPKKLDAKKGIVSPRNNDDRCIIYCIAMAQLFRKGLLGAHPERITPDIIKQAEELDLSGVNFPAGWKDICLLYTSPSPRDS